MSENGTVERARNDFEGFSRQARFTDKEVSDIFSSLFTWGTNALLQEVPYSSKSGKRDEWLLEFARLEPNLQGVLNAVTTIDKNRGWSFTGGRNQVRRFTRMLHNFEAAPGLFGWRPAISQQSLAFWNTDIGAVTELGRDGIEGPLRALYTVDPTRCQLTGSNAKPLAYSHPVRKQFRSWSSNDFFRVSSMISLNDRHNGLGYCGVSRAIEMVKLMVAVHEHDKEELGAKAPRGLLLIQGISQDQWNTAMEIREADMANKNFDYFGAVATLASKTASIDAKLVALSQLPKGFDLRKWTDMVMYTYALCFGYDPAEFWPIQFGALGRGEEGSLQHEKATGKGRLDFVLGYQEQLQEFLPDSLQFEFEQKDEQGQLLRASVNSAWITNVKTLYEAGSSSEDLDPLISKEQALLLLADYGVIPRSWAPSEVIGTTDTNDSETIADPDTMLATRKTSKLKMLRERLKEHAHIWRCAEKFPKEPIVMYSFPANTEIVLWKRAEDLLRPTVWSTS